MDEPHSLGRSVTDYVAAVASAAPAPGGGSVAGLVGALAAALGAMVAQMTVDRVREPETPPSELLAALDLLADGRRRLLDLSSQDERAYRGYIAATRLPKGSDAERIVRHAAQQDALLVAADVPLAVAELARTVLLTLTPIARLGHRHALADCSVGAWLGLAAAHAALVNVRTNAAMMSDPDRSGGYVTRADEIEGDLGWLHQDVLVTVADRNGGAV